MMTGPNAPPDDIAALRKELADLRLLVERISAVIVAVYGPACIAPPVPRAPPPPAEPKLQRVSAVVGPRESGFLGG
jgi:hypothetical protein